MRELVIIGSGPAGMGAAIYACRAGLDAVLINESEVSGGQVLSTYEVDNYPGIPGVSGQELSSRMAEHADKMGILRMTASVEAITKSGDIFVIKTDDKEIEAKSVIVATGATHAHLGVPGEEELAGAGVSYCATCDGAFFKNADVCVIGGSDVAVEDAIYLARTSRSVTLIHRRDSLRAANALQKKLFALPNVKVLWDSQVTSIEGEDEVSGVCIHNKKTGEDTKLSVEGVFIAVGIKPQVDLIKDLVETDPAGYVIAGETCETSCKGLFVAGDIRKKPMRQIITAVADGANAVTSVQEYLNRE